MERYWTAARDKVRREGRCRVCGTTYGLQFAHTIGRKHDQCVELEDGSWAVFVDPDDGIPLCAEDHSAYDRRQLTILPVLTHDEQAAAVAHVGIERALHRLTGQRMAPVSIALQARS